MELDTNFGKAFCYEISEVKKAVVPVDCTMILPDYFPDVMKILRYTAKTVKSPVIFEGGVETVSGNVNIEVNYVSEDGELCYCSQLQPFSHSFDCTADSAAAEAEIVLGEIGCRAVNKRRIDLHGSIEISLHTVNCEEKKLVSFSEGAGMVCKRENLETVLMVGEFYKSFTLEEKGELGYGKPPFGKVLRYSACAEVSECHVIQDKIVTKGEVRVEVLWSPENVSENSESGPFLSKFSYPVSRMVDAKGILLTDICDVCYDTDFPEISPTDDGQDIIIKIKVGIFARVYRKENLEFVSDMFSTECETNIQKGKITVINEAVPIFINDAFFEKLDLPETAESITDIWLETDTPKVSSDEKSVLPIRICLFAKDSDGMPIYFERTTERENTLPANGNIIFCNLSARIKNTEFSITNDGKAEISASVLIDGTAYTALSTEAVEECSADIEKKIEHNDAAFLLCFANEGEKIWDIAKRYNASMENIMNENKISKETLSEKTMLIITE